MVLTSRRPAKSPCTLADYAALEHLFASKPDQVLSWFERLGISALCELETFQRLRAEQPQAAARIAFVAATLGIPLDTEHA